MENKERIKKLPEAKYLVTFGKRKATFEAMLEILESAYKEMQERGGRTRTLNVLDILIIMLGYYHDYRTMENIGFDYGVSKQRIFEAISCVGQTLIKSEQFSLPSKRKLFRENTTVSICNN